jgi:hypothetical protein
MRDEDGSCGPGSRTARLDALDVLAQLRVDVSFRRPLGGSRRPVANITRRMCLQCRSRYWKSSHSQAGRPVSTRYCDPDSVVTV